jgi:phospholipase C
MTALADKISTVVLVIMENRSFDQMLGHLTLNRK